MDIWWQDDIKIVYPVCQFGVDVRQKNSDTFRNFLPYLRKLVLQKLGDPMYLFEPLCDFYIQKKQPKLDVRSIATRELSELSMNF